MDATRKGPFLVQWHHQIIGELRLLIAPHLTMLELSVTSTNRLLGGVYPLPASGYWLWHIERSADSALVTKLRERPDFTPLQYCPRD